MGLLTGGHLSIAVFKVKTALGLEGIVAAAEARRYPEAATKLSAGWGSMSDEEAFASIDGVRIKTYKGFKLATARNHNDSDILVLRYYYDKEELRLVRRYSPDADWRLTASRFAFDVVLLDEKEPDQLTALVTTRTEKDIDEYVRPALLDLVSDEKPAGSISSANLSEELDPDFFMWLLYMRHKNRYVSPFVKLSGIKNMNSVSVGRRTDMSQGVDMSSEVSLSLVARNRAQLGPAIVSLSHFADPEGYFELQLFKDGGFHIYSRSRYDDKELKKLPPGYSRLRMVQDVWQTILPPIRAQYAEDTAWRESERAAFVTWAKEELKKFP